MSCVLALEKVHAKLPDQQKPLPLLLASGPNRKEAGLLDKPPGREGHSDLRQGKYR